MIGMAASPKPSRRHASGGDAALARAFVFLGKGWNAVVLGNLRSGAAGFRELSRAGRWPQRLPRQ
jgi:DNA-binding HxlR family transcriptional regulator